jgi:hypothetical protein
MVRKMVSFEFQLDGLDGTSKAIAYDANNPLEDRYMACMVGYTFENNPFCFGLGYPVLFNQPDIFWGTTDGKNGCEIYRNGELYTPPPLSREIILGVNEEKYSQILMDLIGLPTAGGAAMAAWLTIEQSVTIGGVNVFPDPWEANVIIAAAKCRHNDIVVTNLDGSEWTYHDGKNFAVWSDPRYAPHSKILRKAQRKIWYG